MALVLLYAVSITGLYVARTYGGRDTTTPIVADLFLRAPDFQVEDLSALVDCTTNRYVNITIDLKNYDEKNPHTAVIYIKFYNINDEEIAYGSANTGRIAPGVRVGYITISINWMRRFTIDDITGGQISVTQTS